MTDFDELRYPFHSVVEFLLGGYAFDLAALHLTVGLAAQLLFCAWVFSRRGRFVENATICYFALSIYNNYVYAILGLRFNELFGVVASVAILGSLPHTPFTRHCWVSAAVLWAGAIALIHVFVVALVYPRLDPDWSTRVLRIVLVSKIFVLGFCIFGVERHFRHGDSLVRLYDALVLMATAACALYLLQALVYGIGVTPYGTYWDAGFTGIPAFGSVSIERGHFGKFLIPLFPLFLLKSVRGESRWRFPLFLLVTAINFSASNIAFFACYLLLTVFCLRSRFTRGFGLLVVPSGAVVLTLFLLRFQEQYGGIVDKIKLFAVIGNLEGGRTIDIVRLYISQYALGTSYGGSTLRQAAGLPSIEMGAFAFAAQFSVLAIPLLLGFMLLNFRVLTRSRGRVPGLTRRVLLIGIIMSAIIYSVDILWFVPTIWAPLVLLSAASIPNDPLRG